MALLGTASDTEVAEAAPVGAGGVTGDKGGLNFGMTEVFLIDAALSGDTIFWMHEDCWFLHPRMRYAHS